MHRGGDLRAQGDVVEHQFNIALQALAARQLAHARQQEGRGRLALDACSLASASAWLIAASITSLGMAY